MDPSYFSITSAPELRPRARAVLRAAGCAFSESLRDGEVTLRAVVKGEQRARVLDALLSAGIRGITASHDGGYMWPDDICEVMARHGLRVTKKARQADRELVAHGRIEDASDEAVERAERTGEELRVAVDYGENGKEKHGLGWIRMQTLMISLDNGHKIHAMPTVWHPILPPEFR